MSTLLTKDEYLQIIAFLKLARDKDKETQKLTEALGEVIGSVDMAYDYVYGYPETDVEKILDAMDLKAPNL